MSERLIYVDAPHFCAGLLLRDGVGVEPTAPILRWAVGKSEAYLRDYFKRKKWRAIELVGDVEVPL